MRRLAKLWLLVSVCSAALPEGMGAQNACTGTRSELRVRTRAGHELAGTLVVPRGWRNGSIVVYVSGAGPQTREYSTIANFRNRAFERIEEVLLCDGISSFRYDEVGTGASTGSYASYATTASLAQDLGDVLEHLATHRDINAASFVLVGHSEGGAIAATAAASTNRVIGAVLMAAPAVDGWRVMRDQWKTFTALGESPDTMQAEHRRRLSTDTWYRFFLRYDPAPTYRQVTQPVLIVQGGKDNNVPAWHADSIAAIMRRAGNRSVRVTHFPHHGHAFVEDDVQVWPIDRAIVRLIAQWTKQVTREKSGPRR